MKSQRAFLLSLLVFVLVSVSCSRSPQKQNTALPAIDTATFHRVVDGKEIKLYTLKKQQGNRSVAYQLRCQDIIGHYT